MWGLSTPIVFWFGRAFFLLTIYLGILLSTFGGSLQWQTAVDWENAGVTKDSFLNEAILDDLQAVYRGYTMNNRLEACNGLSFTPEQIQVLAAKLAGQPPVSSNLDDYLDKKAQGPAVKKPQQIFLIMKSQKKVWKNKSTISTLMIYEIVRDNEYTTI